MMSKTDVMTSKRHPDIMHESRLTPLGGVRGHVLAPVSHAEIPVGYARKQYDIHKLQIKKKQSDKNIKTNLTTCQFLTVSVTCISSLLLVYWVYFCVDI